MAVDTRTAATARSFVAATLRTWGLEDHLGPAGMVVDQFLDAARRQGSPLVDVRVCRTETGVRVEVIERGHLPIDQGVADPGGPRVEVLDAASSAWGLLPIGSASYLWADFLDVSVDPGPDPLDI